MKTIPVEQLDQRLAEELKQQGDDQPVLLTKDSAALGLLVRVPRELEHSEIDATVWLHGPEGAVLVVVQAKGWPRPHAISEGTPRFGGCQGMLKIVAEDDEHLKDFQEYMR